MADAAIIPCPACGHVSATGAKFCNECGAALAHRCPSCGAEQPPRVKFCSECGTSMRGVKSSDAKIERPGHSIVDASTAPEGERKTVTALFADIKGSMELIEDLDPEEARAIVDPALSLMMDAVHRYEGYVVQSTGDGIFALFGAPVAHEDHPQRALYAGLRMQDEMKRYAERLRAEKGLTLLARVGVNTGEVVVRALKTGEAHTEYVPIGHSMSLAARLQTLANPGAVVMSEAVRRLVEGYFEYTALGPARVKGVSEPMEVYEVTGLGQLRTRLQRSAQRGLSKFVGRAAEMRQLRRVLDLAAAGHGQIAAVVGEAGVGKSRLFHEFKASARGGTTIVEAFSVSHGKASAYLPVIELLKDYFEISAEDDVRRRREKVAGRVLMLERTLEDTLPYLFALLGIIDGKDPLAQMDAAVKRRRTREAIKRLLLRESLNQPVVVVFEDLHWADDATQGLLQLLADSIATARVLLLVNYRPEYHHDWGQRTYYTQLHLDPLGTDSAEEMLTALLGHAAGLVPLKRLISEKTQGNPFFMEEMVQALFEEGALARNDTIRLVRPLDAIRIPATVQAVLTARIDRLPREEKALLQTLAVVGTEFPERLVQQVAAVPENELQRMLANLQRAELIYERPAVPETEYQFKHALTHDVAYNSVLIERRKVLHEHTAGAIETLHRDHLDEHVNALAHHYTHSANAAKAVEYLHRAGELAAGRSAHEEAIAHLRTAIAVLDRLPASPERAAREAALHLVLAPSLFLVRGYGHADTEAAYERARVLYSAVGDRYHHAAALLGLANVSLTSAKFARALDLIAQVLDAADSARDDAHAVLAYGERAFIFYYQGCFESSLQNSERVLTLYDPSRHHWALIASFGDDEGVANRSLSASVMSHMGYPDRALARAREAVELAVALDHPISIAVARGFQVFVHRLRGEVEAQRQTAEDLMHFAEAQGFPVWLGLAKAFHGNALDDPTETTAGLALLAGTMNQGGAPVLFEVLAEVYQARGEYAEALGAVEAGLAVSGETGQHFADANLQRLKGEIALVDSRQSIVESQKDAGECFCRAIEIARSQKAKSFELRAATSLARLLRDQHKLDAARDVLEPIYNWFTEGFDTRDLKEAKALLQELGYDER